MSEPEKPTTPEPAKPAPASTNGPGRCHVHVYHSQVGIWDSVLAGWVWAKRGAALLPRYTRTAKSIARAVNDGSLKPLPLDPDIRMGPPPP